ncbi:MAG: InlB B-repeat-containing protein, partial [Clostridia bacterium]|nr:InlB B-repeat-containing protein [Clostridia bacterium]
SIGSYAFANINLTGYNQDSKFNIYAQFIGDRAFSNAGNPRVIMLGEGLESIGDSAFENTKFSVCNFPDSLESIGTYAFAHTGVYWDGVTVTNLDASQVGDNDEYLAPNQYDGITFGSNLRSIGQGAFKDNGSLYYVYCNDALEYIGNYAFEMCDMLGYIKLPTSLEYLGAKAFTESNLYSVTIPYNVELGTNAFLRCYNLHDVTFRGGDMTIPYSAFMGCENLISVTFGDGSYYLDDQAFRNDYRLQYLIGPDGTNSSLPITYIGNYAFTNSASEYKRYELSSDYSITMNVTNTSYFTERFTSFFEEIVGDTDGVLPGTGYTLDEVFQLSEQSKYKNYIIATFDTKEERDTAYEAWINADNYYSQFNFKAPDIILDGNTIFENLYLPDVEYIGEYAFSDSGVRNVKIGAYAETIRSYTFAESAIENITFDSYFDSDIHQYVSVKNIYARSFEDTYLLDTFIAPNGLERINANAFYNSRLREISLSSTVNKIAGGAFNYTRHLETITVDSNNPIYKVYNGMLFYAPNTNNLNSLVYYPYTLTPDDGIVDFRTDLQFRSLDTVYDYAFAYNDKIQELYFPKGLKLIKENAFYNSFQLIWLQIPGTIEEIEEVMYSGDYLYIDGALDFEASIPQLIARAFRKNNGTSYYNSVNTNLHIYVPESDYNRYASTVWGVFNLVPYDPEDKIVIVTLELNGGSGTHTLPALIGLPLNVGANPVRSGYKFAGWFTDEELENEYDMESIVENSFTLYAKWKPIEYYINYVMNGAENYADAYGYDEESFTFDEETGILTQKTDYEYLVEGIQFVQPYMQGYNFIGWYRKANFESELLTELDFEALTYRESTGDNPVTLYARFERIYYNIEFGEHEAYEINVLAGYSDPVEYGNNIKFTIVYHDGYTQNVDNQNIRLDVTTTSELKDDPAYIEYYDIEQIEIGTSISYVEDLDEGIRIYTITNPTTDLSIAVEGIEINKYTINFAPNLSRYATGLGNMPQPIVVRHGDNLIEDSTNAEYKMIMYGTIEEDGSTYVYDMLLNILGYYRANLRTFKERYDEIERPTSEFAYTLKLFDSYNDMMTTYQALLDETTLYNQILTNNPTLRIDTSITGMSSVEISSPTVNGYTFKSWNLMVYDSVSGETTVASRPFNMNQPITRDITLAADWNLAQYDIILALNGGQIGSSESETSTINYTIENGFTLPYNSDTVKQITRLGYSFGGWYEGEKDSQGHYISDFTVGPIEYIEAGTYGNKIFVAKWDLNTYDIIYQLSNGGHFSAETIESPDFHDTYTVLSDFDLPVPLRTGYEFAGWYETPNYTGNMINHISPNTREGDLVLYAKWTSVDYQIIYHLNGNHISEVEFDGSIINYSNNIVTQTYTYNEVNDIEIANVVSRNGYEFAGWYVEPELETRYNYIPAGTSGNIDVYAGWEAQEYSIVLDYVYDKNLLVDGANLPDTFSYTFDDLALNNSVTIQPVSVLLNDNSQFFAGWQSGVNIYSTISAANSNIVKLTAVWRNQRFDVFITSNDTYTMPGSSTPIPVTDIVKMVGEDGDITNTYGGSLRFMLYFINKAFSKSTPSVLSYKISSEITTADDPDWASVQLHNLPIGDDNFYYISEVNGNLKLYIDGLTVNNYTVHFLNADGTSISDVQFVHGSTIQSVPNPSKDGYNFAGWYMDSGITVLYNVATPITGDMSLYARFALNEYVVTLKNGINNLTIDIPYSRENEITFVPSTAPWVVEGYTAPQQYRIDGTTTIIESTVGYNSNLTVFAVYGLKEYTITYGVEQGVTHSNPTHYNITDQFALTPASRTGYTFNYWTDSEGRIVSSIAKGTTGDLTLSANFTLNSDNFVAVCYYDSFVKVGELAVFKGNVLNENEFTAPTKVGYTFVAWYTDEELTSLYTFGVTPMYQNLSLYAKYNLSSYNITYTYELYNAGTYVRAVSESRVQNINELSFNVEDPFRFSNATSPGLRFVGWYVSGIPVISTQNLNAENTQIVGRFDYVTYNIVYTIPEGMAEGIGDNVTSFNIDTPDITFNEPSGINPLFNFDHWANTINMNERVDGVYTGTVGDVYVTGVFVSIENYIVVEFYIGTNMETSSKITKGTNALRPVEPTKTGYVLDGWYYSSDCTGQKYDFLTYLYSNTKLYAKWNLVSYVLEVSYSRAPHHMPDLPDTFNVTSVINLPDLEDLTGYAFTGWYEGNNKIQSIIGRSSDLSIIARFELVDYTISYEGVSQELGLPATYNVEGPAYIDISSFEPEKEGYNFIGWSILDGNSWVELQDGKFSKMLAKNVYIRAEYEYIPTTASLTLYLNGDLYFEETVNIGEELSLEEPVLAGYTFDGWYLSEDYTGDKLVIVTDANPVNAYGRMLPVTYSITYNCNLEGVTLPSGNITSYSVTTPSFELINPLRVFGYTFDGWFTGAVLVDGVYNFDNATQISIIYQNNANLDIVAKYTLTVYTITYQLGYGTNAPENVTTFTINSGI